MNDTSIDKMVHRLGRCDGISRKTYEIGWYAYYDMALLEDKHEQLAVRFADIKMYSHIRSYKRDE